MHSQTQRLHGCWLLQVDVGDAQSLHEIIFICQSIPQLNPKALQGVSLVQQVLCIALPFHPDTCLKPHLLTFQHIFHMGSARKKERNLLARWKKLRMDVQKRVMTT